MHKSLLNFNRIFTTIAIVFFTVCFFAVSSKTFAATGILKQINFQGKVVNANGTNVTNGNYSFTFQLYTVASVGTNIWTETKTITVTDGIFRTALGDVTAFPGSVDFNTDNIYLGINFNSDGEMTPRVQFTAVPYAFNALKVAGLTVTDTTGTFTLAAAKTLTVNNTLTLAGTDSTTFTFPSGTGTVVTLDSTATLTNKTIGSTGLTFSGPATDITTAANEDFTLTPNGLGNTIVTSDFNSGLLVGSSSNTLAPFSVSGGIGSNALAVFNQTNLGDVLAASTSGVTKFRVANNGDLVLSAAVNVGGTTGTSAQCLLGGASAAWGSCAAGAGSNWDIVNGVITPKLTSTLDFLLGSAATGSAKFAVLNINSGTPTATISAQSGSNSALVLGANATIQSVKNQTLTIGGDTTGNIILSPNNGSSGLVTVNGALTATTINGNTFTTGTGTLTIAAGKTLTASNTLTLSGTDGSSLAIGAGGTLGSNAFTSTAYAPLASPTFTGTVTIPTPFTLGSTSVTSTGTQLNYLNAATGTTGTATTNLVFSTSPSIATPTFTGAITAATSTNTINGLIINGSTQTFSANNIADSGALTLGTGSNNNLTLTPNGSGNILLTGDFDSQVLIGATSASTEFPLFVNNSIGSNASLAINNINSADLFTASASGVTKFTVSNGGNITAGTYNGNTITTGTGILTLSAAKTLTVSDSTTLGTNSITLAGGEVITFSATNALSLLTTGATSVTLPTSGTLVSSVTTANGVSATNTAGALAFTLGAITPTTVNGLTVTANGTNTLSIGAGLTLGVSTASKTLTGAGTQITIANSLDFGAGTTGTITLGSTTNTLSLATTGNTSLTLPTTGTLVNSGVTTLSSLTTVGSLVSGTVIGSQTFTTNNIADSGALTIKTTTTGALTLDSGTTGIVNIGTGTSGKTINIGTDNTTADALVLGSPLDTIRLAKFATVNGVLYVDNANGNVAETAASTAAQCLQTSGVGTAPIWGACGGGGGSNWDIVNGAITPKLTSTLHFLLGSQATGSAKFAVLNINTGTPTASVSAGAAGGAYISASGVLATTAKQSLVLGDSNTGDVVLGTNNGNGSVRIQPNAGGQAALIVNKQGVNDIFTASASGATRFTVNTLGDIVLGSTTRLTNAGVGTFITGSVLGSQTFTTNNIVDSGALTIKSGGTSALTLDTSGAAAINVGNTNATSLVFGNVTTNPTFSFNGSGLTTLGGGLTFSGTTARTVTGPATGGLTVNTTSGPLTLSTTTSGTVAVTSAGALNLTGVAASTWLTSGASSTLIIEAGATTANTALTVRTANQSAGTTNSGGLTILSGNAAGATSTAGNIVLDVGTSTTSNGSILIGTAARNQTITIGNSTGGVITIGASSGSGLALNDAQWSVTDLGAATFVSATSPTHTGVGAVTLSSGGSSGLTLDSASGRVSVATADFLNTSVAGVTGAAAGDVWYDSTAAKYKINEAGATKTLCNLTDLGCGAGGGGGGSSNWTLNNGVLRPNNNTLDILFGGTSTSSAKFAFMNMNSSSGLDPLASFSGDLLLEKKPNASAVTQTTWTQVSGTVGTIGNGATTLIASTSASAIYNGSVYAGTYQNAVGGAEVYRYNGTTTSWTKVSQATAGTISSGGTTNVASVSAMTVFDGYLYAGTSKMNSAEVYRYDGGTTWTRVSQTTAGTIRSAGTASIDGVSSLGVYQGRLYAGTREGAKAELYRYDGGTTWTVINTTAGTFVTTNTVAVNAITAMVVKNGTLYLGTQKTGDADTLRYSGGAGASVFLAMNAAGTTGSYTINGTAVTAFDEVTAMTVYNGNVIVGLRKANAAEVLMMNDSIGEAGIDTWTRLGNAAGQLTNGGTASIDQITALTVYNGMLFVGTNEPNGAEIYRYVGTDQKFFKVTQAAGTIASGGTAAIDGISFMQPTNGDLYAGTFELGKAEVYKYTASIDRSYALQFHAAPQIGGGEQSSISNIASIFYVASASANLGSNAANTGAIVFSHGIQTRNGSYDIAEDYPTRDDSLTPGDLVAIDPNERGFVKKSDIPGDDTTIGVYSEKPALRLTQEDVTIIGGRAIPVALAGRVPVKVTTENGSIRSGNYLTSSSIPGVAMKATKAGTVVGQAMESYDQDGIGKIIVFVRTSYFNGALLVKTEGEGDTKKETSILILEDLISRNSQASSSVFLSQIVSDQVVGGLEVITPKVVTKILLTDMIQPATGQDIALQLTADGKFLIKNENGETAISFDSLGNAFFKGQIQADSIHANKIEGLEIITSQISKLKSQNDSLNFITGELSSQIAGVATSSAVANDSNKSLDLIIENAKVLFDMTVLGKLQSEGSLVVLGPSQFQGNVKFGQQTTFQGETIFEKLVTLLSNVIFKGKVTFEDIPTFNSDTAGFAVIKKGADRVSVIFDKEYESTPIVSVGITLEEIKKETDETEETKEKRQEEMNQKIVNADIRYIVTKRTTKGFIVLLNKKAEDDITFSWLALAVKDSKKFESVALIPVPTAIQSEPTPTPTQVPIVTDTPVASTSAQ